jgi:hypothetical protein
MTKTNLRLIGLYSLISVVVFDGLLRRLAGPVASNYLFFLKDAVVLFFIIVSRCGETNNTRIFFRLNWLPFLMVALIVPCFVQTLYLDPVLAVFGAKQYIFYPWIAYAVFITVGEISLDRFEWLLKYIFFLIIGTSVLAVLQLELPSDSFFNRGVGGGAMEEFSAGGYLRVCSTFPFVGQYCYFLNFAFPFLFFTLRLRHRVKAIIALMMRPAVIIPAYLAGAFATASRTAVWGGGAIAGATAICLLLTKRWRQATRLIFIGAIAATCTAILADFLPQTLAGYSARSAGELGYSHNQEMFDRISNMLVGWISEVDATVFGHGLGTMSNGVEQISHAAAQIRGGGFWTENDLANTYYEGGWYWLVMWMGMRLFVIIDAVQVARSVRTSRMVMLSAALTGYIIVQGLMGTLGIQPPVAIWFWMAVGLNYAVAMQDTNEMAQFVSENREALHRFGH